MRDYLSSQELWGLVSGDERAPVMPVVPGITRATTEGHKKAQCPEREKSEAGAANDEVDMLL